MRCSTAFGAPMVAPSANRSGHVSPTSAAHVLGDLRGRIDLIVDGGPCTVGVESTIVACLGRPTLLRPGGVPREDIERVLGSTLAQPRHRPTKPRAAPGMLVSHYAPKARLRLNAEGAREGEALLAFGPRRPARRTATLNLSPARRPGGGGGQSVLASARARCFRRAGIAVMPVPHEGLGEAINDRLQRAAAPRRGEQSAIVLDIHQQHEPRISGANRRE